MKRKVTVTLIALLVMLISSAVLSLAVEGETNPVKDVKYYKKLVSDRQVVTVLIDETSKREKITKSELMESDKKITDVKDLYRENKKDTDLIKTGDYVYLGEDEYKVILYGDVNRDGTICDIQDIMYVLDMMDGTRQKDEMRSIAGNIDNTDKVADVKDVIRMANIFLGIYKSQIITNIPEGYEVFGSAANISEVARDYAQRFEDNTDEDPKTEIIER